MFIAANAVRVDSDFACWLRLAHAFLRREPIEGLVQDCSNSIVKALGFIVVLHKAIML